MTGLFKRLMRRKTVDSVREVTNHSSLKRTLGPLTLIAIGIGAIVGSGVFTFTGIAAQIAGPAVTLSFLLSGLTCIFVALSYTEIATTIPSAGGVYTYSYVTCGEMIAWLVGWIAIMQSACGAMVAAMGWSGYIVGVLNQAGINIPGMMCSTPFTGGIINLPAVIIVWMMTFLLARGTEQSSNVNMVLVILKLMVIVFFIGLALPHFDLSNWNDFMPYGVEGVAIGAGTVFVAYTGFDSIANATEETKNPEKNTVIGLIGAVVIATIMYVLVAVVLTGMVDFHTLNNSEPLARALKVNGSNLGGGIVAVGAITGMTTVVLVQLFAMTRIIMAMSRDGFLPGCFSEIHKKYRTPYINTIVAGGIVSLIVGFCPIEMIGQLASVGTLILLLIVVATVAILRKDHPNLRRPFRCPYFPLIGTLGGGFCIYLIYNLSKVVGDILLLWLLLGIVVYLCYGYRNLNKRVSKV